MQAMMNGGRHANLLAVVLTKVLALSPARRGALTNGFLSLLVMNMK